MAKRFTATEKWDDPWFFELDAPHKLAWIFLLDRCNHAGIWNVNLKLMEVYVGFRPSVDVFQGRVKVLGDQKWFIPKFIEFQYGALNPANRAHQSVISILRKEGAYNDLTRPLQGHKDMDKEKDLVKDKGGVGGPTFDFEALWAQYPKKDGRRAAERHFRASVQSVEDWGRIQKALANYLKHVAGKELQYIKNGSTWFNNWTDWVEWKGDSNGKQSQRSYGDQLLEQASERKLREGELGQVPKLFR